MPPLAGSGVGVEYAPVTPQGQKAFRAAQGYMELEMLEDAADELASISGSDRHSKVFLQLQVVVLMKLERWEEALASATELCERDESGNQGFIHRSFCLHELGRTEEARDALKNGPDSLRDEAIYYYNMGCYEAVLGQRARAIRLVLRAITMDDALLEVARDDHDLIDIRSELPLEEKDESS